MAWTHRLHLRFRDLDYLGHVTAAAYLAHYEEARATWLAETWQMPFPVYVVAVQHLEYLAEVRLHDSPLEFVVAPVRVGTASFDMAEELRTRTGELKNRSRATLVAWDLEARRSRPLTGAERAAIAAQIDPVGAASSSA
jgi:acyl-CoA thioester hydrolase